MNFILKSISYLFHPLIMPLVGVIFYFSKSPRFIPQPIIKAKIFALVLLTILLPILLFFLLKSLKKISSIHLGSTEERRIPLAIYCGIIGLVLMRVLPSNELIEPHFFMVGVLGSTLSCLILAILNFKASIHMLAVGGVLMFFIALSIHFHININGSIALIFIITGALATSRVHMRAHNALELAVGFIIGVVPQFIVLSYWL
ncbi:MAG: hypothetical protein HKN00_00925 [Flavobacteriaceae bacterium]|nr:hypothetical protein [Bacteroidia bacterium]NNF73719.1 hypothetical protein [Flavobacteriaceae bacterium]NNK71971.1 hypothetical protein [Flavobacteriaceae bacterium]